MVGKSCFAVGVCLLLQCVGVLETCAQAPGSATSSPWLSGARVGPAVSWLSFNEDNLIIDAGNLIIDFGDDVTGQVQQRTEGYVGASGGVQLSYGFRDAWGLEARVLLASQGAVLRGTGELGSMADPDVVGFATVVTTYRTVNVNVPVLARVSLGAPRGRFYLGAGPEFGFLISASRDERLHVSVQGTADQITASTKVDIKDDMKSATTSLTFLGGWESGGSGSRGFLEVGYAFGLGSVFTSDPSGHVSPDVGTDDVRHRGLTIMAGATF